ncbi:BlaI/MecI/CopY family transcriptional regulator [Conexibacter sp. W3-3-2]|uniref:BlaI/MecI/CopY family transcriptional regulator n=1 Tax=Conexibacter sp. W3-3-2 TaxID=2675227 RepID=UPI0018AABA1F|nr:BlaI/MecI/CopY family transcriptional regulator [Conexibacter sp. W3-3-2]
MQSEIMEVIWRRGEVTVREVLGELNESSDHERAYTTVMTTMRRLHDRGMLERERRGKTDLYRPAVARDVYIVARAQEQVSELVAEYGDVALQHFAAEMAKLDPARRESLRRLARKRA